MSHDPLFTRRSTLAALTALAAAPAPARAVTIDEIRQRAAALDQLHSLVIAQDGDIVLAEAFRGPAVDRPVNVKSVSKTIVATLTGIAGDRGVVPGTDATLGELAPSLIPRGADPRVGAITLADLLTMRAGLERTSGANYGAWVQSPDWIDYALSRPFVAEPGERFLYSTGSYHVLGAALAEASGRSLLDLARDWLGGPLDVEVPPWTRDPQGFYLGGNNMAFSPLAMVRFGETWRLGGVWAERRVISGSWIDAAWTPRTRSPFSGDLYGYGWFLARTGQHDLAYARGYGGQMIYVVPSLGLTVAVTSDPNRPARSRGYVGDLHNLLAGAIIPAVAA